MMNIPAPYTLATNVTNFIDLFSWMNASTTEFTGLFGTLILMAIFITVFILNSSRTMEVAFAIASWITCISAIFLSMLSGSFGNLIPGEYVSITVAIAAISVIILYIRR
jgi:hypothetical protein